MAIEVKCDMCKCDIKCQTWNDRKSEIITLGNFEAQPGREIVLSFINNEYGKPIVSFFLCDPCIAGCIGKSYGTTESFNGWLTELRDVCLKLLKAQYGP